jgi:hypothetical protein
MTEKILFATPAYGNMVTAAYCRSALVAMEELTKAGIANDWLLPENNDSLVHRARMEITATFLRRPEFSHLFWIDADIEFSPNDVAALWNLDADIAVGVYAMKKRDAQWFAAWKDGALVKDLDQWKGPEPVDYAGTGFMLIKRGVLQALWEHLAAQEIRAVDALHDLPKTISDENYEIIRKAVNSYYRPSWEGANGRVPALFMTPIHDGGLESEDYHFCRIAREAGFKIIMDPSVRLKHWGSYAFGQ